MKRKKEPTDIVVVDDAAIESRSTRISDERLIELRKKGNSEADIARVVGCTQQNVSKRLKKLDLDGLQAFHDNKATILELKQRDIIAAAFTPEKLETVTPYQAVGMLGILQDKVQVLNGNATSIVDVRVLTASIADITKRMIDQGMIVDGQITDIT